MDFILSNRRLEVTVQRPTEGYSGSRFDYTGFIPQVHFCGHTFCVPEQVIKGRETTGGIGLCNEFGLGMPIGYDDIAASEFFPKIGVGKLTKPYEGAYPHLFAFEKELCKFQCGQDARGVWFRAPALPVNGYAFDLQKRVSIDDNTLTIFYQLQNEGEKPVRTQEYVHNFVGIDGLTLDEDYTLIFPAPFAKEMCMHTDLIFEDQKISFQRPPQPAFMLMGEASFPAGLAWEVRNTRAGVGMREITDFPIDHINLWGVEHVLSPEVFILLELAPGETKTYTRTYEFFQL